ncbi:unnamed protein product [Clavelina lepadiformis]|uniref:Uncharacterized protein n=1 Tax=Clavelina lepadiformis TaxID=159417 RepID=A0ABP0F1C9_CLALP
MTPKRCGLHRLSMRLRKRVRKACAKRNKPLRKVVKRKPTEEKLAVSDIKVLENIVKEVGEKKIKKIKPNETATEFVVEETIVPKDINREGELDSTIPTCNT